MQKDKTFECELCAEKCCTLQVKESVGMPFMCPFDSKVHSANWFEISDGLTIGRLKRFEDEKL